MISKRLLLLLGFCPIFLVCFSQLPRNGSDSLSRPVVKQEKSTKANRTLAEICDNGIDDDNNGLVDCDDYSCYFNATDSTCQCQVIDILWICTPQPKLFWTNLLTGTETEVGTLEHTMTDITWTEQGELYGVDWNANKIWKINPADASDEFVMDIPGYDFSNAMTSDAGGNLYLASRFSAPGGGWHIIKVNPQTLQVSMVANLAPQGLVSAGDLAFSNGTLYLACLNNTLAKININTGQVTASLILGLPPSANIYGIVSVADGSIYLSDVNRLYKLNLTTMQATLYYTFSNPAINIWGLSNFNDYCNAPAPCLADVNISVLDSLPYCPDTGVRLRASGSGILADARYTWTLPGGGSVQGDSITAFTSGVYRVRYHSMPDTCGAVDSVFISFTQSPGLSLGPDDILCEGQSKLLGPNSAQSGMTYLWQDGSANFQYTATQPGLYWLKTTNVCGSSVDSIVLKKAFYPVVDIGPDRELCLGDTLILSNKTDAPGYKYLWSNGGTSKFIICDTAGRYTLSVTNVCGTVSDTAIIKWKQNDCECFVFVPSGFTPDFDGKNDRFRVHSNCMVTGEISIFNRWGQLVYRSKDITRGWDGKLSGLPQSAQVYVYLLKYRFGIRPGEYVKKGSVVLIR